MKPDEIRKLSLGEIQTKLDDSRDELMKLRFQQVIGKLTDTSRLRILRRDIARMQTIAREVAKAPVVAEEAPVEKPKARARKAKAAAGVQEKAAAGLEAEAEKKAEEGEA
jgi:large subunit ribosomal protein L29